jgi:cysteine desulfurase
MTTRTDSPIYLDYQATTPVDSRVMAAMRPFLETAFGNPHSVHHAVGREAEAAVEAARAEVADLIGAQPREIVFTSGATESNNLAIKGAARFHAPLGKQHVVTVPTEHKCVLESCKRVAREGGDVSYVPVDTGGLVDPEAVAAAIRPDTVLVSVMAVNNEIGVIQPIAEIAEVCRAHGVHLHVDAAQAAGKVPLDVSRTPIDLMSISGHKIYGPKGIGALYVRRRPRVRLEPLFDGGGQERGLRPGTLPAPLAVGLGAACRVAGAAMASEPARLAALYRRFRDGLAAEIPDLRVNGNETRRIPGNINVCIPGVNAETLIAAVPELAISTASACSSASVEPSYVLSALGLCDADAAASLRIGFGRFTTAEEIDRAVHLLGAAARRLRGLDKSALDTDIPSD